MPKGELNERNLPFRRFKPREERHRRIREALEMHEKGETKYAICHALDMDIRTLNNILSGKTKAPKLGKPEDFKPLPPEPQEEALLEEPAPSESQSVEFLRNARDNPDLAWADRIKCALAVAKLESGPEEGWTAPTDPRLWAEALADALASQPVGVLEDALSRLNLKSAPEV